MINQGASYDRDSSLFVARGLYFLRYESSRGASDNPTAVVRPAPGSEAGIEIISAPGRPAGRLEQPGEMLIVRAAVHGNLHIGVKRKGASGSLDAAFKLESVGSVSDVGSQDANSRSLPTSREVGPSSEIATSEGARIPSAALFLAHISRRGDVWVGPGEWAAGPDLPGRIEGLGVGHSATPDVGVEVQALAAGRDANWSDWKGVGAFVGSRGRSQPLVGVRLRLTGGQAHRFIVDADALFLGSAIMKQRGREVECISAARRDPLVGFRFEICSERRLSVRAVAAPRQRDSEPRVRIFRASVG